MHGLSKSMVKLRMLTRCVLRLVKRPLIIVIARRTFHLGGRGQWKGDPFPSSSSLHAVAENGKDTSLTAQLYARIKAVGPMSVADYMRQVLISPETGYYMHQDVFGDDGDFITSPEITQLLGEMVAVWCFSEWQKLGAPKPLQLVELGPGRGSLAEDLLRVFAQLGAADSVSLHLVEISPHLSNIQAQTLCNESSTNTTVLNKDGAQTEPLYYRSGISKYGSPVFWYNIVQDIPHCFSCFIAHEFFDALPVYKFQKTKTGWKEILIDIDPTSAAKRFRYVLSQTETVASKLFIKKDELRDHVEICPEAAVTIQHLSTRLEEDGGFALIADYGHNGTKTDTFRAFRRHKLHDPLVEPGSADLTADVDFAYLRDAAVNKALTFGPVTQADFLCRMGIDLRLQVLLKNSDKKKQELHQSGYGVIMDKSSMGERFKFFAMFPLVLKDYLLKFPVAGFYEES